MRLVKTYGGSAKNWVKMSGFSHHLGGRNLDYRYYMNLVTGQAVELKPVWRIP